MDVHHLSEKLVKRIWEQLPDVSQAKLESNALLELDFLKYIDDRKNLFYNKDFIAYAIIRYGQYPQYAERDLLNCWENQVKCICTQWDHAGDLKYLFLRKKRQDILAVHTLHQM